MNSDEYANLKHHLSINFRHDEVGDIVLSESSVQGNQYMGWPIATSSRKYKPNEIYHISDEAGEPLAELYTLNGVHFIDTTELSDVQYLAYVFEVNQDAFKNDHEHTFLFDWVFVKIDSVDEYLESYKESSSLWGCFCHKEEDVHVEISTHQGNIYARKDLFLPTEFHRETIYLSLHSYSSFERFLKYYHMIELVFDLDIVEEINALGDDLYGISKVLSKYNSKELNLLKSILLKYIFDIEKIKDILSRIQNHSELCYDLIFKYSKSGLDNKITQEKFESTFGSGDLSDDNLTSVISSQLDVRSFLIGFASFFTYRIRCSIAHNRIGEFIFKQADEIFIFEVGK